MRKEQWLVNAQVEINRAVWAMNLSPDDTHKPAPGYIRKCIDAAIVDLQKAKKGYPAIVVKKK
jgi:hypothetical protein